MMKTSNKYSLQVNLVNKHSKNENSCILQQPKFKFELVTYTDE